MSLELRQLEEDISLLKQAGKTSSRDQKRIRRPQGMTEKDTSIAQTLLSSKAPYNTRHETRVPPEVTSQSSRDYKNGSQRTPFDFRHPQNLPR